MSGDSPISYEDAAQLMLANKFGEAETRLGAAVDVSPRHALMYAQVSFAKACLSLDEADATVALERAWAAEKRANDALVADAPGLLSAFSVWGGTEPAKTNEEKLSDAQIQLENEVVQADAYLMASLMQLILGSYVKGAWNVRAAWKMYEDAQRKLSDATSPDVATLVKFGVGMFNLMVSLMPPEYLQVSKLAGFSGDRNLALELLAEGCAAKSYWSPFAGLLVLFYHTRLAPLLGLVDSETAARATAGVAPDVASMYPEDCALFAWMHSAEEKLHRRNAAAYKLAEQAALHSGELPPLRGLAVLDQVFCCLLELDFETAGVVLEHVVSEECPAPASFGPPMRFLHGLVASVNGDAAGGLAILESLLAAEDHGDEAEHRLVILKSRSLVKAGEIAVESAKVLCLEQLMMMGQLQFMSPAVATVALADVTLQTPLCELLRGCLMALGDNPHAALASLEAVTTFSTSQENAHLKHFAAYEVARLHQRASEKELAVAALDAAAEYPTPYAGSSTLGLQVSGLRTLLSSG